MVVPTDVADREQVDRMAARALEHYGAIDVLVNNAGKRRAAGDAPRGRPGPVGQHHTGEPIRDLLLQPGGTSRHDRAGPGPHRQHLRRRGDRPLIPLFSAYVAGKVGIMKIAEVMALELAGSNIRVNCVCPGGVATRMLEGNRDDADAAGLTELRDYISGVLAGKGRVPRPDRGTNGVPGQRPVRDNLTGRVFTSKDDPGMIAKQCSGRLWPPTLICCGGWGWRRGGGWRTFERAGRSMTEQFLV